MRQKLIHRIKSWSSSRSKSSSLQVLVPLQIMQLQSMITITWNKIKKSSLSRIWQQTAKASSLWKTRTAAARLNNKMRLLLTLWRSRSRISSRIVVAIIISDMISLLRSNLRKVPTIPSDSQSSRRTWRQLWPTRARRSRNLWPLQVPLISTSQPLPPKSRMSSTL